MQFNYSNRISRKSEVKKKVINFFLLILALLVALISIKDLSIALISIKAIGLYVCFNKALGRLI